MIIEALKYILYPAPPWVKKLGYLSESIGIEARFDRCSDAWAEHLHLSKKAILQAADMCEMKRTALIVGSGPCYDVPLEDLLSQFSRIILLDAVHPRPMRKLVHKLSKKYGQGRILSVTGDVTEISEALLKHPKEIPQVPTPSLYHGFLDIDLVVSLNIASQLPITPLKWLTKHHQHQEEALERFKLDIVKAHLAWLTGFSCQKLLICDRQWTKKETIQGRVIEREDPLSGVDMPRPDTLWTWQVCPVDEMPTGERKAGIFRENIVGSHFLQA